LNAENYKAMRALSKLNSNTTNPHRFGLGDIITCNCAEGWTLGRVVALDYREDDWPDSQETAPYQVLLEEVHDRRLIYVPVDDDRVCRRPTTEDLNVMQRLDALAPPVSGNYGSHANASTNSSNYPMPNPYLTTEQVSDGVSGYRDGRCECCDSCPRSWSAVELYSEHYRAAERNGLPIVRHKVDLGTVKVGFYLYHHRPDSEAELPLPSSGFLQCPTLPRLPPGVTVGDDGSLSGTIRFDPHRGSNYKVEFVAVSTADWQDVGLVRLEITFCVEENFPPKSFDLAKFKHQQQLARTRGERIMESIYEAWEQWEASAIDHDQCIHQMTRALHRLRDLLEEHPRLERDLWWTQLGGYHMNVHKLLDNKLFECELYLGQALLAPDAFVRRRAEQNLEGCYQKRLLETARYLWYDGLDRLIRGEYATAIQLFEMAASKKDGWGWGVNHGDIWISAAAAHLLYGAELVSKSKPQQQGHAHLEKVPELLDRAKARWSLGFGTEHPWAMQIRKALVVHRKELVQNNASSASWIEDTKKQTVLWTAGALQGSPPFPPRTRPRKDDARALRNRMPGHHT
jgi:hypothetical protein